MTETATESAETAAKAAVALTPEQRSLLAAVVRTVFPHDRFPDGPYERTADAIAAAAGESDETTAALSDGLDDLGPGFADLDEDAATKTLKEIEDGPFFTLVRTTAVVALYDDREVWELLGYEGPSFDQGGYRHRGFDDLDWLPPARITEYEGEEA